MNGDGDTTDEIPFVINKGYDAIKALAGSFGCRLDVQMGEDGSTIVYGPATENFRTYMRYLNKLYTEGLINSDFAVNEDAMNLITQNKA